LVLGFDIQPVGRLLIRDDILYFEYDEEFQQINLEIVTVKRIKK